MTDPNNAINNAIRYKYRDLTEAEKEQVAAIKGAGATFLAVLFKLGSSRELSLSQTRIEEAVMWGVKHVTGGEA